MGADRLVELCRCRDAVQLQTVRASLEARGIDVVVEGTAVHGALGPLQGAALAPRMLVPREDFVLAREIAEDVLGPFDDDLSEDDDPRAGPLAYRRRPDALDEDDPDSLAADDDAPLPRRKSVGVVLVLGVMMLAIGFAHLYVRRPRVAAPLFVAAAFGIGLTFGGNRLGPIVLAAVWLVDVVGSLLAVRRHNHALEAPPPHPGAHEADEPT